MEPQELKSELSAVCAVLFTPFDNRKEIDEDGLRQNISFLIEKSKGHTEKLVFIVNGSMSEFYALTEEEQKRIIEITVDEVGNKALVIAGTGHSGTRPALIMSQYAEDAGAEGVMIVTPYYHTPTREGMYQHYKTIAEGVNIGIILYNNLDATKAHVDPQLMSQIADIPNVIALKENSTDLSLIRKMMKLESEGKVRLIVGKGEFWYAASIPFGCSSFVSSIANFYPEFSLDLLKAGKSGNFRRAWRLIEEKYIPLQQFIEKVTKKRKTTSILPPQLTRSYTYLAVRKAVMPLVGLRGSGKTRLPITVSLTEDEIEKLRCVLETIGLSVER